MSSYAGTVRLGDLIEPSGLHFSPPLRDLIDNRAVPWRRNMALNPGERPVETGQTRGKLEPLSILIGKGWTLIGSTNCRKLL